MNSTPSPISPPVDRQTWVPTNSHLSGSRTPVATADPNISYGPPEVTLRTGSKRPHHSTKDDNESKTSRSTKRTRVLIDGDPKSRLIDRPLSEAFMRKPDKNLTVCAKIRFYTLSEDRSDGKQSILLYALQKAKPLSVPKALGFTTSKERTSADHINNAQGQKSGRKLRAEEMHERKSRFVELENVITKFDSGRAKSQLGDIFTSWGDNSQGTKVKTSATSGAKNDTSSVPSDYRPMLYADRFGPNVSVGLNTGLNLHIGSTANGDNSYRSHANHQSKGPERQTKRSGGESDNPALFKSDFRLLSLISENRERLGMAQQEQRENGPNNETLVPDIDVTASVVSPESGDNEKRRGRAAPPGRCHSCNRAETVKWLPGPDGQRTLCNACGLHYAKLMRGMGIKKAPVLTGSKRRRKGLGGLGWMAYSNGKSEDLEDLAYTAQKHEQVLSSTHPR